MVKKIIKDLHRSVKKTKTLGGGGERQVPTKGKDIFKSDSTFGETGKDEVPVQASGKKGTTLYIRLLDYFLTPGRGWHIQRERDFGWMIETLTDFSTIGSTDTCGNTGWARAFGDLEQNIACKNNKIYSYLLLYNIANYYNIIAPDGDDKEVLEKLKNIFWDKLNKHVIKLPKGEKSIAIQQANASLKTDIAEKIPQIHVPAFEKVAMYIPQQPSGGKKTRKRRKNRRKTKRVKKYYK